MPKWRRGPRRSSWRQRPAAAAPGMPMSHATGQDRLLTCCEPSSGARTLALEPTRLTAPDPRQGLRRQSTDSRHGAPDGDQSVHVPPALGRRPSGVGCSCQPGAAASPRRFIAHSRRRRVAAGPVPTSGTIRCGAAPAAMQPGRVTRPRPGDPAQVQPRCPCTLRRSSIPRVARDRTTPAPASLPESRHAQMTHELVAWRGGP